MLIIQKKKEFSTSLKNANDRRNSNKDNNPDICAVSQTKFVNRKDDKTFINEKMVIKPDPNKSIFKSNPNPAFFNQANTKSKDIDIVLVTKGEPPKFNNNNINKIEEKEIEKNNDDVKASKPIEKKEKSKKVLSEKKEKVNNNSEIQEKKDEPTEIGLSNNKNETENLNKNENKIKEKVEPPSIKPKAPILRNKKLKRNQDKEEQNDFEKDERKENIEENKSHINNKKNINKKDELNDDEIDDYKNYIKRNESKKIKTKKENESEAYDPNIINTLLSQMNSLSEKQLSLIDVMDNIQMETQGQIKDLNKRITKLERNIEELNNELYDIKNDN